MAGANKILRIHAQARLSRKTIKHNLNPIEIIKQAEIDGNIHKFKKDVYFCAYPTEFENVPAVIFVFTLLLPGPVTGSSASSEIVMDLVGFLEKVLMPIDKMDFTRDIEGSKKNIATVVIKKKVREEDII